MDDKDEDSEVNLLKELKAMVAESYGYFGENANRFYSFKNMIFKTALTPGDVTALQKMGKSQIEANSGESYISQLRGEFAEQEPGVELRISDSIVQENIKSMQNMNLTIEIIEAHLKHILDKTKNDDLQSSIHTDQISGGYSVVKVATDYANSRSFEQTIYIDKVFDPTMCVFDPLARDSHKGDGRYAGEISPYTKESFVEEFGEEALDGIEFTKNSSSLSEFCWAYNGGTTKTSIIIVCQLFYKKKKKKTLVWLADGRTMLESEYNAARIEHEESGSFEPFPSIRLKRKTTIEQIWMYRFCQNKFLDKELTDYSFLPLIFVDGNSVMLRDGNNGSAYQMTRPYLYHAAGLIKNKNFAFQTLSQQVQNLVQHKIKVPLEAIPKGQLDAYTDVQTASVLLYRQYDPKDKTIQYNPPQEIQQTPPPPFIESLFVNSDKMMQTLLGNYDSAMGTNERDVSGVALKTGAIQSSISSSPYLINYIRALNRVLEIVVDLIPKYYVTPRTLPIIDSRGRRGAVRINDKDSEQYIKFDYTGDMLDVKVSAGVNSVIQKQVALESITRMMAASEQFAAFINTKCLNVLVKNLDIRGSEELRELAEEFTQEQKEIQEEARNKPSEVQQVAQEEGKILIQIEDMKNQIKMMQIESDSVNENAKNAIAKQKADIDLLLALAKIDSEQAKDAIEQQKVDAEQARTAVDIATSHAQLLKSRQGDNNEQINY